MIYSYHSEDTVKTLILEGWKVVRMPPGRPSMEKLEVGGSWKHLTAYTGGETRAEPERSQ